MRPILEDAAETRFFFFCWGGGGGRGKEEILKNPKRRCLSVAVSIKLISIKTLERLITTILKILILADADEPFRYPAVSQLNALNQGCCLGYQLKFLGILVW